MIRESTPGVSSRMGLALAYIADEDWTTAEGHYKKAMEISPNDSILASAWVDAKTNAEGADAALRAATAWATEQPASIAAQYAQLRATWHAGGSYGLSDVDLQPNASRNGYLDALLSTGHVQGVAARAKVLIGSYDDATKMAKEVLAAHPHSAEAWLALAEAQSANQEDFSEALKMAIAVDPWTPAMTAQVLVFSGTNYDNFEENEEYDEYDNFDGYEEYEDDVDEVEDEE